MHPIITIFCAFTRRWAIDEWLENLAAVQHDPSLTNLCFIIDCEELYIRNMLKKFAEDKGYRALHIKMNDGHYPNETRLAYRRQRVAEVHEQAKYLIAECDGDYVIGLEDDTVFDRLENFDRLLNPIIEDSSIGFVEGVQMGRHGARMIGAWQADDIVNPTHIETLLPAEGYQDITGGGWYGYATTKQLYLDAPYYASTSVPWGPDVEFGFWLQQRGHRCIIDWSSIFGHNDYNTTMYSDDPNARLAKVIYDKDKRNGKWNRTDHEPSRN
jgi:hypothetical protein